MIDAALLLPKILARAGDNRELSESAAKIAWSRVAGEGLRQHTVAIRLHEKKLIVAVADAVWQKQMQSMSAELIFRINKLLRSNVVDALEFQIKPAALHGRATSSRQKKSVKHAPLPESVITSAAEIEDADLRERFMRAAENCISRREAKSETRNPKSVM
jgi:hypothetical protein